MPFGGRTDDPIMASKSSEKEKSSMKKRTSKLLSLLLALVMVVGLMPQMVFAEGNTSTAPRVSAYATKTQLMDGTFAPKADGTAVN